METAGIEPAQRSRRVSPWLKVTAGGRSGLLSGVWRTVNTMRRVFTGHAITRYIERVRPGLSPEGARNDLLRVCRHGNVTVSPPAWLVNTEDADAWLLIGNDIAFPIHRKGKAEIVVTCIARGTLPPGTRQARNRRRAARTFARIHKSREIPRTQVTA